jgi:hypothetical protein
MHHVPRMRLVLMRSSVRGGAMLKANALEVFDAELARFEERLEKLMQKMDRAKVEIRKEIRKTKLMIISDSRH